MTTWRLSALLVDAVRNVICSPMRSVLLAATTAGLIGALVLTELSTTDDLLAVQSRFVDSGGNVVVAFSEEGLDSGRCAAIAYMSGTVETAAVTRGSPVEVGQAPGTLFNSGSITTGALTLFTLKPTPRVSDVIDRWVIGSAAAAELGLSEGMWLTVNSGEHRQVGAVIDTEVRNPQIDRWILRIGPAAGTASQCWVEFAPGARTGRKEMVETMFADSSDILVTPWIRPDKFSRDPVTELATRPQTNAWLIAGLLLAGIGWLGTWFRRSHVGLYRAVGTGPATLLIIGTVEYAIPILLGGLAGTLWATAAWTATTTSGFPDADQLAIAVRTAASTTLLALVTAPLLWPAIARGSIAQQLKDR